MVSTTAGGRPLKSAASHPDATHGGSTDLDAGAIWCRTPERGGPSSEECAREVLSWGKLVRETRSGWAKAARPAGPAPRPPWACTCSLWEMHTCVRPEASCVPVRPCRGGPRSGKNTAGSGRTRGKQTGGKQTWTSPNRLQIRRIVSGWSRHSPGNESCRESASAARLSFPGMSTARSDLNCMRLQRRRLQWLQLRKPYAPGASETVSVVPHSCLWRNSSALLGHARPWGVPSYSPSLTPHRENRFSAQGRACSFPSWPEAPYWLRCRSTKSLSHNCSLDWAKIGQSSR